MRNVRLVLVLLAVVFVILSIFIGLPLWLSVLCLCAALLVGDLG